LETLHNYIHREIIEQCKQGDNRAFKKLYDLYSKAMYNISIRLLNDRDEAQDVLQEAFSAAFLTLGEFRYESTFGAWLKKIVVYKCINVLKKRQRHLEYLETTTWEITTPEEIENNEESVMTVERVKYAISKLPEGSRAVFSLYLLEGYDHTEISGILNISESTSKTQLMRAKQRVREILKEYGYEKSINKNRIADHE
jgi:RNA polymerase sigma factor (sigma-70 family)